MNVPENDGQSTGRHSCKRSIIQLNVEVVKDSHGAVSAIISEKELRHG